MDGCMDIYTLESKDKGEHWSTPVIIPKYTLDFRNRWRPRILINPKNNYLWIFYIVKDDEYKQYSIGFVRRSEGSSTYNNELRRSFQREIMIDLAVALAIQGEELKIQLIFTRNLNGSLSMTQMFSSIYCTRWDSIDIANR